jgi:hypothetical protein
MAEIRNKCFRPKHEISELNGHKLVTCVEMPIGQIVFMENYSCGCCKCGQIHSDLSDEQRGEMMSELREIPDFE